MFFLLRVIGEILTVEYHPNIVSITVYPCPFSVLALALFIYYNSVSAGTEARTEVK